MIKAYLVEFEELVCTQVRYLCASHAAEILRLKKEYEIKFFTKIHGDVYDKKCHLCKVRKKKEG